MTSTNLFSAIEEAVKNAAKQKAAELAHGNAETYSDYMRSCGYIEGLNSALYIFEDVFKRYAEAENK